MFSSGTSHTSGRKGLAALVSLVLSVVAMGCSHPDPDWNTVPTRTAVRDSRTSRHVRDIQENEAVGVAFQLSPTDPRLGAFGWYWRIRIEGDGGPRRGAGFDFSVGPTVAWGQLRHDVTDDTRPAAWVLLHGEPSFSLRFAGWWFLRVGVDVRVMARRYPFHFNFAPTVALGATPKRRRVELAVSYAPVYAARVHTTEGALDALDWAWFIALRVDHSVLD